jgi:hypothetical protein
MKTNLHTRVWRGASIGIVVLGLLAFFHVNNVIGQRPSTVGGGGGYTMNGSVCTVQNGAQCASCIAEVSWSATAGKYGCYLDHCDPDSDRFSTCVHTGNAFDECILGAQGSIGCTGCEYWWCCWVDTIDNSCPGILGCGDCTGEGGTLYPKVWQPFLCTAPPPP